VGFITAMTRYGVQLRMHLGGNLEDWGGPGGGFSGLRKWTACRSGRPAEVDGLSPLPGCMRGKERSAEGSLCNP
jgi:hypothetical protein